MLQKCHRKRPRMESRRKGRRSLWENALARGYGQVWNLRLSRVYFRMSMKIKGQETRSSNKKINACFNISNLQTKSCSAPYDLLFEFLFAEATGSYRYQRIEGRPLEECKYKQASVGSHRVQIDDFQTTYKKLV